ncbi:MAG TPA: hypothetical protein VFP50_12855 [Anaeromyxobacteraceae bacterium]|nr:hypothetical protein [Anaeromyxobacteraceae bacterium]
MTDPYAFPSPPIPLPIRLDVHYGAPMRPPPPEDDAALAAFADEVAAATQALLDRAVTEQRASSSRR